MSTEPREVLERAAELCEGMASAYPVDVFPEPLGKTTGRSAAQVMRDVAAPQFTAAASLIRDALASLVPAAPSEGLVVSFIDPGHLALWLEDGEIAGRVEMDEGITADGMIRVWRNDDGVPMVDVSEVLSDDMFSRTPLGNVRRIEVL